MNDSYQYFTIEGVEVIVQYGSLQYKRKSRVSYEENLSDGKPVFHNAGYSKVFSVDVDILIPITNKTKDLFKIIDNKVYKGESVKIESNFGKIFPSGNYYLADFEPKYLNQEYYECSLTLTYIGDGVTITEFKGQTNKLTTNNALLSDKNSVSKKINSKKKEKDDKKSNKKNNDWKTISQGSSDTATVKKIQRALKRNGYYIKINGSTLKVDGDYGKYTKQAVQQFQKTNGLKVTGKVDSATAKKLNI